MSTTLTNGLKLPDKGSVDWYADMQSNYTILDGAVGTIAEHTTALAGKAPAVHTHTKSDITDFPVYGTTAGTICEGNDSRLSDARTPVAHTHTKSDVTDLFNSVNSWAENNRFFKNAPLSSISSLNDSTLGFSGNSNTIFFNTRGSGNYPSRGTFLFAGYSTGTKPDRLGQFKLVRSTDKKGETNDGYTPDPSFNLWRVAPDYLLMDIMEAVRVTNDGTENSLKPITNNTINLGTSTNKWKTLNGVNPGGLSIPSSDSADYIDLSDYLSTNAEYLYTAPYDGWLCLYVIVNEFYQENAVGLYRSHTSANSHQWAKSVTAALNLYKQNRYQGSVMLPVESGKTYVCYISVNANATINRKSLFFYKNKGNV